MERLSLGLGEWKDFNDWIDDSEIKIKYQELLNNEEIKGYKKLISDLKKHWVKEYGSGTKITEFFSEFMTKEEQIQLINTIRYSTKVFELPTKKIDSKEPNNLQEVFENWEHAFEEEQQLIFKTDDDIKNYVKQNKVKTVEEFLPICFNEKEYWKCYSTDPYGHGQGYCRYNYDCPLPIDRELLDDRLKKTIQTIYDWRSKFVHQMILPPIRETASLSSYYKGNLLLLNLRLKILGQFLKKCSKDTLKDFPREILLS